MKNFLLPVLLTFNLISCKQGENLATTKKPTNQIVIGQIDSLYSNILDESREVWIHIPESTKDSSLYKIKYPVLYVLDGPSKDILLAINESEKELKSRIKITLAIQLYTLRKLTIGKASQLSGLSRFEFEKELSKNKISISNLTKEDVLNDSEKLK